ncbi:imidazolonepropionase [Caldiplasma sukawensis]
MNRYLIIYNPARLTTVTTENNKQVLKKTDGVSIVIENERIHSIENTETVLRKFPEAEIYDASGKGVFPGFIDSHTHILYAGDRSEEFQMRVEGVSYEELLKKGQGIKKTAIDTENAGIDRIVEESLERLNKLMEKGVSTVEIKTGYSMNIKGEKKLIEALNLMRKKTSARLLRTYLPLHASIEGPHRVKFIKESIEMLSHIGNEIDFVDAFCDSGAYTPEECSEFFKGASIYGKKMRIHADEIRDIGALNLLDQFKFISADHLLKSSRGSLEKLKLNGTVPVVLPSTAFSLKENFPDINKFREAGLEYAIGTDTSPLNPVPDILFSAFLAVRYCNSTLDEAFRAITVNGARSLGLENLTGKIEKNYSADISIFNRKDFRDIVYSWNTEKVSNMVINGRFIW